MRPVNQISGHTRLKNSLVLRNALAAELGLNLAHVMPHLFQVEDAVGAPAALDEGRYVDALVSVCAGDRNRIVALDTAVREACAKARLAPRYAQYLALLLFAHWNTARLEDSEGFLARLNGSTPHANPSPAIGRGALISEILEPFTATDVQTAAFWMATAAGKTHVLHACLALLQAEGSRWDRIVLITPSEALTRQHADKLLELQQWEVFAYPMDGDQSALGRLPEDTVIVIDINKLSDSKKGDGVTVPMSVFKDGRNLVFVDEGHKGQRSEASVWKKLQQDLAGIDAAQQDSHRGLLVEFSATFGQVAEAEHAFSRYAKSVVFDYAYDRFHADLYGKDFWHLKLEGRGEASAAAYNQTLTAALIAYWHQLDCFQRGKTLAMQENLEIAKPLWVLLGLSVIGGKTKGDQEQTSDVVDVLRYLYKILHGPAHWLNDLTGVLDVQTIGTDLLPLEARSALAGYQTNVLAERILSDVFGWQAGDKPVFRLLKNANGELGLGLLRADAVHYFGVVNVGDAAGLKKKLEESSLIVEDDALSASLFAGLARGDSLINVLIGSRRFAEGWDNYRASSLTLLRLGQGEGSLIIQMFGRVVRFAGRNGDGRRLRHPSPALKPLQTAYVYGLRSKYLEAFLAGLYENGVPVLRHQTCPFSVTLPDPSPLRSVEAITPAPSEFNVILHGDKWLATVNAVMYSLGASIEVAQIGRDGLDTFEGVAGQDITELFKARLAAADLDAIYREMIRFKQRQRWWNFSFDRAAIRAALHSDRYHIVGLPSVLELRCEIDLARINRIAVTLVRRLFENAYRKEEARGSHYRLIEAMQSGIPASYHKEIQE